MLNVLFHNVAQLLFAVDNHLVDALSLNAFHEGLRKRIHHGHECWQAFYLDTGAFHDGIKLLC
jgi:hypothetical protein